MDALQYHVIKDPVHGVMQFTSQEDRWIKPFIDHPAFQRLRHIKQLGLADLIFPGAVHTRLNHGMGCCYVGTQIANKIGLSDEDKQLVMIACLLHDVGHGPFSHAFEEIFVNKSIRHEMWTDVFLAEFSTPSFLKMYNALNPAHPLDQQKLETVKAMIMHRPVKNPLLADIVSSQLDADRLDYLLRDSHFCGVQYGEFDFRWMLHCLCPVEVNGVQRLGINHKGIGVVEHYLMARRLMLKNIYHHRKKYAIEFWLVQLLKLLSEHMPTEAFLAPYAHSPLGQFLLNVKTFNDTVQTSNDIDTLRLAFFEENVASYQALYDYHVQTVIAELARMEHVKHPIVDLAKRIHYRKLPKIYALTIEQTAQAEQMIQAFKEQRAGQVADWQIGILKMPQLAYAGSDDPIYVKTKDKPLSKLTDLSLMVDSMSDKYEHNCALLVDQAIADEGALQTTIETLL